MSLENSSVNILYSTFIPHLGFYYKVAPEKVVFLQNRANIISAYCIFKFQYDSSNTMIYFPLFFGFQGQSTILYTNVLRLVFWTFLKAQPIMA